MPNQAMTPHISGTTIDAQVSYQSSSSSTILFFPFKSNIQIGLKCLQLRYAAGVKDMLDRYFKGEDFPPQNYIVKEGKLASQYL